MGAGRGLRGMVKHCHGAWGGTKKQAGVSSGLPDSFFCGLCRRNEAPEARQIMSHEVRENDGGQIDGCSEKEYDCGSHM